MKIAAVCLRCLAIFGLFLMLVIVVPISWLASLANEGALTVAEWGVETLDKLCKELVA